MIKINTLGTPFKIYKTLALLLLLCFQLEASQNNSTTSSNFYIGFSATAQAKGYKSFGSGAIYLDKSFNYTIDKGIGSTLGYRFNDILSLQYSYTKFFAKEYKDFSIHSVAALLSTKYVSTQFLFNTTYNFYPSYEIGISDNVFDIGINLHCEYNRHYSAIISYRSLTDGLGIGGESNQVDGYYLGVRYLF